MKMHPSEQVKVHPEYAREVANDSEKQRELILVQNSFPYFLKYWKYLDQERGNVVCLGEDIWEGQEQIIEAAETVDKYFNLKARKLGASTIETAYDAWVLRFRDSNARVHLFSRREDAAKELLDNVKRGLKWLPPWMQLPVTTSSALELKLYADNTDERLAKAYPTSEETAVEASCTHGHVDEWARMKSPELVWQAIEPSMAGTCHILTTGRGPTNFASVYYRQCLSGETDVFPIFLDALQRPDRDQTWLEGKRKGMTASSFRQEYPMRWEDAMYAGGAFKFRYEDVDVVGLGWGPTRPVEDHRYVKAWDIGRHYDAAVCTVIDVTAEPMQVVEFIRLKGMPYPDLQKRITKVHQTFGKGVTVIESNAAGEAVAENVEGIPESQLILFNTGPKSKAQIIEGLQLAIEQHGIMWNKNAWPALDNEIRGYQIPDDDIVQDAVMSLAIGVHHAAAGYTAGRLAGSILKW